MKIISRKINMIGVALLLTSCALLQGEVLSPSQVQENINILDGHKITINGYLIFERHNYTIWDSKSAAETYMENLNKYKKDPCLNIDVSSEGYDVLRKFSHRRIIISGLISKNIFSGKVAFGSCTVPGIFVDIDSLKAIDNNSE